MNSKCSLFKHIQYTQLTVGGRVEKVFARCKLSFVICVCWIAAGIWNEVLNFERERDK